MRLTALIALFLLPALARSANGDPNSVRQQFVHATQNVEHRSKLVDDLQSDKAMNAGFRLAYLGASKTLLAESSIAPWMKYNYFVSGTELLEEAITIDPDDAEFRYLRFIIQINSPSFLDYDQHLQEDYFRIKRAIREAQDQVLWMEHFKSFEAKHTLEIRKRIGGTTN